MFLYYDMLILAERNGLMNRAFVHYSVLSISISVYIINHHSAW